MEQTIKQRLVGVVVLVLLTVIILPFVFDGQGVRQFPNGLFDMPDTRLNGTLPSDKPFFPDTPSNASEIRAKKIDNLKRKAEIRNLIPGESMDKPKDKTKARNANENTPKSTPSSSLNPPAVNDISPAKKSNWWRVQLATFGDEDPAHHLVRRLERHGHKVTVQSEQGTDNLTWYVIVLVVQGTHEEATRLSERLAKEYQDIDRPIIRKGNP